MVPVGGGELNGYALVKTSGIPRVNVYAVAGKLVQRGAAQRVARPARDTYAAIEPGLLLWEMEAERRKAMDEARQALASTSRECSPPVMRNLRDGEVPERTSRLIDASTASRRIALQPSEAAQLAALLRAPRERGVALLLCAWTDARPSTAVACRTKPAPAWIRQPRR